ncbi:MAG: TnpV protein [Clostridia bacterium]|nr:TnpV protein [Clostridia bacterium]
MSAQSRERTKSRQKKGVRAMIEYKQNGDYLIPDVTLNETKPIGRYGRMRKQFLKENRPILYSRMLLSETLYPHLLETEEAMERRMEELIPKLAETAGATEKLKAADPMKWVGLMNNCKAQAEEILLSELVYS